jgi:hypothetical protein
MEGRVVAGRKILKYIGWGIGILAGSFILMVGAIIWFVSSVGSDCPAPEIISKHPSPDHRHEAVVYTYNCGPWDDWVYHLSVVKVNEKLKHQYGNAFSSSKLPPEVEWMSPDQLLVKYDPKQRRRLDKEPSVDGVRLVYRECVPKVLFSKNSPNDVHTAYIYERSCGRKDEPRYHLSIVDNQYGSIKDEPGNVFQSSEPFRVEWKMPGIFVVHYDPRAKITHKETKYDYIDILYQPEKPGKK